MNHLNAKLSPRDHGFQIFFCTWSNQGRENCKKIKSLDYIIFFWIKVRYKGSEETKTDVNLNLYLRVFLNEMDIGYI